MDISQEGRTLMYHMIKELSSLKYGYRTVVEGCYDTLINNCGLKRPMESKSEIVVNVIDILGRLK
jgi:hypothetical protein